MLGVSAAVFGCTLIGFVQRKTTKIESIPVVLTITISSFWLFSSVPRTPSYNELNLCALLWLFAALLYLASQSRGGPARMAPLVLAAAIAGAGVAVAMLCKPTSGVAGAVAALAWIFIFRIRHPILIVGVGILSATVCLVIAAMAIFGSLQEAFMRIPIALSLLHIRSGDSAAQTVMTSLVGAFGEDRRWKIPPAIFLGSLLFIVGALVFAALQSQRLTMYRGIVLWSGAVVLCLLCAIWRIQEMHFPIVNPGFHAWRYAMPMVLLSLLLVTYRSRSFRRDPQFGQTVSAAVFLSAVPLIYSIGTNNQIVLHISGGAVFWVAAIQLCVLTWSDDAMLEAGVVLCCGATMGVFISIGVAPVSIATPLWLQTERITVGPAQAPVLVDADTSAYIRAMQKFVRPEYAPSAPLLYIIDLSGIGPGIPFALGASESGTPWLVDGPSGVFAYYQAVLQRVPRQELDRAWVLTNPNIESRRYQKLLMILGLDFPSRYERRGQVDNKKFGWSQIIWRPKPQQ